MRLGIVAVALGAPLFVLALLSVQADEQPPLGDNDRAIARHAQRMIARGRQIFRFDTFGSEAFFGDALQLHKAIAGAANGGVGPGVSPKSALAVGPSRSMPTPCPMRSRRSSRRAR